MPEALATIADLKPHDKIWWAGQFWEVIEAGNVLPDDGRRELLLRSRKTGEDKAKKIQAGAKIRVY